MCTLQYGDTVYFMSKLKRNCKFQKRNRIERYTQFTTVTLIYKKVPKQDEQVNLLHI